MKINNLKKSVFTSLKITHASAKNIPRGDATSLLIEALLFRKGEISKAHKEMVKEKYKSTIMKSYQTRIRDQAEVPRDPQEFHKAISRILRGQKNNEAKKIFLEQMLRILPSKNKLFKMNKLRNEDDDPPPLMTPRRIPAFSVELHLTQAIKQRTVYFQYTPFMP